MSTTLSRSRIGAAKVAPFFVCALVAASAVAVTHARVARADEPLEPLPPAAETNEPSPVPSAAPARAPFPYPEASMPPPLQIDERGESGVDLRQAVDPIQAGVRLVIGPSTRVVTEGASRPTRAAFALDVLAGMRVPLRRGSAWNLLGELGYSFVGFDQHLVNIGIGPMVRGVGPSFWNDDDMPNRPAAGRGSFAFGLVPRFVAGSANEKGALGIRTSLVLGLWLWSIEVSHQYLTSGSIAMHQVGVGFSWWPYSMDLL